MSVSNMAVVERAEAEFVPGLNVITGETGAGKSVFMGALQLVLGGRADASIVREGAKEAEVEAEFDGRVLRRTVTTAGRSRAWIDDESVSVAELRQFGERLVDMHGPTANQRLLDENFQRDTVDAYGSIDRKAYAAAFERRTAAAEALAALERTSGEEEADLLRYQIDEIERAELVAEDETLSARHAAAAHAEEIMAHASAVTEALGGDEGVVSVLGRTLGIFAALEKRLPEASAWRETAENLMAEAEALSRSVADATSGADGEAEDLEILDARLTLVNRMKRKYGASVAEILEGLARKRARLDELDHRDERMGELRADYAKADAETRRLGAVLTKARRAAGARIARAVTSELKGLGFVDARFTVALEAIEPGASGMDRVTFVFEPNPGEPARPLAAIASSGEIARVMLAVKGVLAAHEESFVQVFDEIDANIGGEIGRVVGARLKALAAHRQVIAITHLPQSAAFGERHFVVSKVVAEGRTRTTINPVEGASRVAEVARMLGGEKITGVVRKHAEELLGLSH